MKKKLLAMVLVVILALTLLPVTAFAGENWSTFGGCQWQISSDGTLTIKPGDATTEYEAGQLPDGCTGPNFWPWHPQRVNITNVVFEQGVKAGDGLTSMFQDCTALTSIDFSDFDTSKATSMNYMFSKCSCLIALNLLNFNTANVTSISNMFSDCSALSTLDLSSFKTDKVADMTSTFKDCSALKTIYVSKKWENSAAGKGGNTFRGCSSLKGGEGSTLPAEGYDGAQFARIDGGSAIATRGYLTGKYTVTFDSNGGTGTMDAQSFIQGASQKLTTNAFTKTGFTFSGWMSDTSSFYTDGQEITASDNMTLNAMWTQDVKYTLTIYYLDKNTGTEIHDLYETQLSVGTPYNVESPEIKGYTPDRSVVAEVMPACDVSEQVFYTVNTYTATFDVQGHGTAPEAQLVAYGAKVIKPADPTETGYTFGGWYKEAACENAWDFNSDTMPANDTTLYAKWTAKTTPKTSDITFTAPSSLNYDKTAKVATVTGKEGMGTIAVRYTKSPTSEEWTNEPPINAGTYYVKVCITEGTQYAAADLTDAAWTFTITPAKLQVTLSQNSFVYNGKEQQPEVTVNGVEGDNLTEGIDYQVTIGQATRVNVGTYTVNVAAFNANYASADEATYTITEANVPTTGDTTNMWLYIALAALALGAMGAGTVAMRRKANR